MTFLNACLLYGAFSAAELYFFLMQRAALELSRTYDVPPPVGRQMLPLWYGLVWPIKVARWVSLYFVWSTGGWVALAVAWAIPFGISMVIPVPFKHFVRMFHHKVVKDIVAKAAGHAGPTEGLHATQLLALINDAEQKLQA